MSAGAARILRDAAQELETNGWCQGLLHDDDGRSCAMGALDRVCWGPQGEWLFSGDDAKGARQALSDHLGQIVAMWNDKPDRTEAEVVKLFLTVADIEEVR